MVDAEPNVEPDLIDVSDAPEDTIDVELGDVEVSDTVDTPDAEMDVAPDTPDVEPDMGGERWERILFAGSTVCAVTSSDIVRCWGRSLLEDFTPEWARSGVLSLGFPASGSGCALLADRSVRCWGEAPNPGGPADEFSCGSGFCCALERGERLTCRGEVSFSFEGNWRQLSASGSLVCGLRQEITRVAHDCEPNVEEPGNIYDRIGTESDPVHTSIGSGGLTGYGCTLLENGDVRCWGDYEAGRFPGSYRAISAGYEGACAITTNGTIECTGSRGRTPVWLTGIPEGEFSQVSVGFNVACAITTTGNLLCWGSNEVGQLDVPEL